jgi:DNA invertase Pin-like site-specific DNA recombinase
MDHTETRKYETMNPIPVAILVRVSTNAQDTQRQITELTTQAQSLGWTIVEVVREQGVSGASKARPGLRRVMELVDARSIEKVMVHEVSRVARVNSTAHLFIEELTEKGVSLYWHAQRIETLLPDGRRNPAASIMFSLLAEMARNERETLSERVKSGLAEARRKGRRLGRPTGSVYSRNQLLEKHADVVRLLRSGQSIRHAATLSGKAKSTVERVHRAFGAGKEALV